LHFNQHKNTWEKHTNIFFLETIKISQNIQHSTMIVYYLMLSSTCLVIFCDLSTKSQSQIIIPKDIIAYQFNQMNMADKNNGIVITLQRPKFTSSIGFSFCLRVNVWTLTQSSWVWSEGMELGMQVSIS